MKAKPQQEPVRLVPYDPNWPKKFEKEKYLIEDAIGKYITGGIHHFGSTAVPGMKAKPTIDILVGVDTLKDSFPVVELLKKIGYKYFPYKKEYMYWFLKPSPKHRTHHLHVMVKTHPEFKEKLAFRDLLRENPHLREQYMKLKDELAVQYQNDREAYTEAKKQFIEKELQNLS